MNVNRDQFLEDGFLILRNVVPADGLDGLRQAYETLIERQKRIWSDENDSTWETSSQPRLHLQRGRLADEIDADAGLAVEFWLHENMRGVSNRLLGTDDAAVTEMMLMCSPQQDHGTGGHRGWHRDFYPPRCAPLEGYIGDIIENGPRYIQWNVPLFDDDVLWIVPGSHKRRNTPDEDRQLLEDDKRPLDTAIQAKLNAGDGVVYILPILHWGSRYDTNMRRVIHGGFSEYSHYDNPRFADRVSASAKSCFERWKSRSERKQDETEAVLRSAIGKDGDAFIEAVNTIDGGRGEMGNRQTLFYLSKAAKRIYDLKVRGNENLTDIERGMAAAVQSLALQWGLEFAERFSTEDARTIWERFEPIDEMLRADEDRFSPAFQGGPTKYFFNEAPAGLTIEGFIADWGR